MGAVWSKLLPGILVKPPTFEERVQAFEERRRRREEQIAQDERMAHGTSMYMENDERPLVHKTTVRAAAADHSAASKADYDAQQARTHKELSDTAPGLERLAADEARHSTHGNTSTSTDKTQIRADATATHSDRHDQQPSQAKCNTTIITRQRPPLLPTYYLEHITPKPVQTPNGATMVEHLPLPDGAAIRLAAAVRKFEQRVYRRYQHGAASTLHRGAIGLLVTFAAPTAIAYLFYRQVAEEQQHEAHTAIKDTANSKNADADGSCDVSDHPVRVNTHKHQRNKKNGYVDVH